MIDQQVRDRLIDAECGIDLERLSGDAKMELLTNLDSVVNLLRVVDGDLRDSLKVLDQRLVFIARRQNELK
ncbi:hypothetical protein RBSH_04769 [Rhodopirellula baltica SH28]|uniref:Uncharacterized protein n=1 Tax=Rhodopirellula baltica SH28 TaxID=993517 RepID=K5E1N9_RHOBT|nr:hypothetical protein RBSH_04769 [Rhodopirellula baltica SH28]